MKTTLLRLMLIGVSLSAHAQSPTKPEANPNVPPRDVMGSALEITPNRTLHRGDTVSISIASSNIYQYMGSIIVVSRGHTKIEVLANGRTKGVIEGKRWYNTSTKIDINDNVTSLEFRHESGSRATLSRIITLPIPSGYCNSGPLGSTPLGNCTPGNLGIPQTNSILGVLQGLVALYSHFGGFSSMTEVEKNLGPVKIAAIKALSMSQNSITRPEFIAAAKATLTAFDSATPYIQTIQNVNTADRLIQRWLQYGEALRSALGTQK